MAGQPAYFDASVLVKRYVQEDGSALARVLLRRHRCVVSAIGPLEVTSALLRRAAAGHLSGRDVERFLTRMQGDRIHWDLLEVDRQVLEHAEEIVRGGGVRTLDALHLASAMTVEDYSRPRLAFVTADAEQRDAGVRLGLQVIWVA
jgi:hypothetical protein